MVKKKLTPQQFSRKIGIEFNDLLLLTRALTHRSYLNENPEALEDNERLEFLGDAILDFIVGDWLYQQYPEMSEGDLTQMRAILVQTDQLAKFAQQINLGDALRLGRGESKNSGNWRVSLLCNTFESLIGAIYLDQGMQQVQQFISPFLEKASKKVRDAYRNEDPKSRLQEWAQSVGYATPKYILKNSSGPDHQKIFEVEVILNNECVSKGKGNSKQQAEKAAARLALKKIGIIYNFLAGEE